jgi:phytanoyl-CoA hydroxylase
LTDDHAAHFREHGYAIVRGLFPPHEMADIRAEVAKAYAEGMKHHASYRDGNLYFEVIDDPGAGGRVVLQAHWFSWINPRLEALRRDPRVLAVLEPLLGPDIKQIVNQIHWKPPSAAFTGYRFHQDLRFRERPEAFHDVATSSVTMGLAIDPQTAENGALQVFPDSHKRGYLGLSDDGPIMVGTTQQAELRAAGLDPRDAMVCVLEPGDVVLWGLLTVHGSAASHSARDRCFNINSYVRADATERGEWAFRGGRSVSLGDTPRLCKYEGLFDNPGPYYVEDKWYA